MHVMIAGTRGIPARHGGFETFAEDLAIFLAARGHHVTVYCQIKSSKLYAEDTWKGVHRVLIPAADNPLGTISYDWATTVDCSRKPGVVLTLGYNTAIFSTLYRLRKVPSLMNMDGIEWKREKWTFPQRAWLWFNEWAGARLANHLVVDHPEIAVHLRRHTAAKKMSVIPYGSDRVTTAPEDLVLAKGLHSKGYYLVIARPEPENSILEIVKAFSSGVIGDPLVVLGEYPGDGSPYRRQVLDAAGENVHFLGAIYDRQVVGALRFHAKAYIHGHRVGGTNPSLVESLGAGNAIIAQDNRFNRWVAGSGARYFKDVKDLELLLQTLSEDPGLVDEMEKCSRQQHLDRFDKETVLRAYEDLLLQADQHYR